MNKSLPISAGRTSGAGQTKQRLYAAWAIVLLLTIPQIVLGAFMHQDVEWLAPARLIFLAIVVALTFVWQPIRPLRRLILVFLAIYVVEGWLFSTVLPQRQLYASIFGGDANRLFFGERLMRIGASAVMLLVLLGMGLKRQDFFLTVGHLRATAEPERWGVPRKPENWVGFSLRYALIIITLLLFFMVPALHPSLSNLSVGSVLFAALCAVMNAFAEEFLYRSALLPQVLPLFGKGRSLILVAVWFGVGHYFGVPSGITGVILTGIGGWVFAKAMVETRGMGWSLFMHFVSDFTIYVVILLAGGF